MPVPVVTETITPAQAFSGFANASVLLVVVAFIVAKVPEDFQEIAAKP